MIRITSATAFFTTVGAALVMMSTSGTAFVATRTASPRLATGSTTARHSPAHARAEETCHDLPGAAAAATTAKPKLVTAACDFETFFDRYRVRPRGASDSVGHAEGNRLLVSSGREEDIAASLRSGGGEPNGVLVVEDLQADDVGNILGFCGAIDSPKATSSTTTAAAAARDLSTYISLREGREIDELTASLLARALHSWLGQEEAGGGAGWQAEELAQGEGEMVDWVDTKGSVICALPRPVVHSRNVLHRGAGVMIRNDKGEVYCHRRTSTKRVFPSMYDMFIGGVSGTLEPVATTALRELGEELGLGPCSGGGGGGGGGGGSDREEGQPLPASLRYRGECLVQTELNRCVVSVFDYRVAPGETVRWQEEEVDWGSYLPWHEVVSKVSGGDWEFVPDGLQVWRHYLEWEKEAAPPSR